MPQMVDRTHTDARTQVENWLAELGEALSTGDAERAAGLFAAESY